jgi:hypothetical protein
MDEGAEREADRYPALLQPLAESENKKFGSGPSEKAGLEFDIWCRGTKTAVSFLAGMEVWQSAYKGLKD